MELGTEPHGKHCLYPHSDMIFLPEITPTGYPLPSPPGMKCHWRLVTTPGAQVMLNFKVMNMLQPQDSECRRQSVWLEDPSTAHHSLLGGTTAGQEWCGDLVPNYPGPSTFTAGTTHTPV